MTLVRFLRMDAAPRVCILSLIIAPSPEHLQVPPHLHPQLLLIKQSLMGLWKVSVSI